MKIKSEGFLIHVSFEEASALMKLVGKSSLYTLQKTFGLSDSEANQIQSMYDKLIEVVPQESEAG